MKKYYFHHPITFSAHNYHDDITCIPNKSRLTVLTKSYSTHYFQSVVVLGFLVRQ